MIGWWDASIHAPSFCTSASSPSCSSSATSAGHPLFGLQRLAPLLAQPLLVTQETHQLPSLLPHVGALVPAVAVHVLEVPQRLKGLKGQAWDLWEPIGDGRGWREGFAGGGVGHLDSEGVFPALLGYSLRARLQQVVQQRQSLMGKHPLVILTFAVD